MRYRLFIALVALIAAAGAQQRHNSSSKGPAVDGAPVIKGEAGAALDAFMTSKSRWGDDGFSGCALVAVGGEVLLEKGYGLLDAGARKPMPANALWDWASVTKQFTAAAILKLEMQKKLSIDDALTKIFKDAPKDKAKVTLRHLLDHTSGIKNDPDFSAVNPFDRNDVEKTILKLPLVSAPGEKWDYSNVAYFLLGIVVEKVSGKTYEEYVIENLFRPAEMKSACFIGSPGLEMPRVPKEERGTGTHFAYGPKLSWGYRGAGGAVASVREMLVWDRALRGDKILSAKAKQRYYEVGKNDYALGWFIDKRSGSMRAWHSGRVGKLVTWYVRDLDKDVVVALAYNCKPPFGPDEAANELIRLALRR